MKFLAFLVAALTSTVADPNVTLVNLPTANVVVGLFPNATNANASVVGVFQKQPDGTLKLVSAFTKTAVSVSTVESLEETANAPAKPSLSPIRMLRRVE
ncbi:hypothetical protein LEN26_000962 [Aphanomyces euteiches]|nr:hypothetical protein LEN26_000962 [Aphanomyces euteiches]